ncbi:UrcA family protein [Acidomonas methanolica]|uniref:UrcA family protein n=1 Tax=Acidomonas methanolica NBRC 104435 TaxID=1231351 RepID=A0A023D8Y8_ACIMT|nr:UrcA family protein [Acidomonas methanolica]MBU2654228.1 UrcA family protein [Acidomonas methanolica]TCS29340.1 UrcA family protein [Acidomonas methanolica]GAJ30256.1 hypothetical protein Amme_114_013 [Acidomonas methanolica NBRC 104435]GBQ53405.1 hypothetical protein AA0498_1935 [Acidomonas methanolica]GEK99413.1 hypothetical protein AME01nite_19120 [Acidomonas methanolica NBRC 104435]
MIRTSFFAAMLFAALPVAAVAAPAPAPDTVSTSIDISSVDLSNDANWDRVSDQVAAAAAEVCERVVPEDDRYFDIESCEKRARQDAHEQMKAALARQETMAKTRFAATAHAPRG